MKNTLLMKHFLTSVLIAGGFGSTCNAELIPGTTLSLDMQAAQLQANGRNLNVYRLPVTDTVTGAVSYFDAVFQFGVLADGSVGFTRTTSASVSSAQLRAGDNFVAGTYRDAAGNLYTVSGPATLPGGRLSYAIAAITQAKVFSATWITGERTGHPLVGNFSTKPAEGSSAAFGILGDKSYNPSSSSTWAVGYGIGATQVNATTLVLSSYSGCSNGCSNVNVSTSFTLTKN